MTGACIPRQLGPCLALKQVKIPRLRAAPKLSRQILLRNRAESIGNSGRIQSAPA